MRSFALIGLGEVAGLLARDLHAGGAGRVAAFDVAPAAQARAAAAPHVEARATAPEAARGADVLVVAMTAGALLEAMAQLAPGLAPGLARDRGHDHGNGPLVVDVNSVSPGTKRRAAAAVEAAGGRHVEAAVMASVPPLGLRTPMLLGGPARRGLRRHHEAARGRALVGDPARGADRGALPARRLQRGGGRARHGRGPFLPPGRRHGDADRLGPQEPRHHARGLRHAEARAPGARGQARLDRLPRRRPGRGGARWWGA